MPYRTPTQSFQNIRNYTEKWSWIDPVSGLRTTGFVPPKGAKDVKQVPFYCKWITGKGEVEQGNIVTLKVDLRRHQRKVMFVESGQIRIIRDYLIMEVDGTRFITH